MMRNRLPFALAATVTCAVVAACQVSPTAQAPTEDLAGAVKRGAAGQAQAPAPAAPAEGVAPAAATAAGPLRLQDPNGKPLAGAVLVVGGQRLVADEAGLVNLPADLKTDEGALTATVEHDGFVGRYVSLTGNAPVTLTPVDSARQMVGPEGGILKNSRNDVQVVFPPGALATAGNVAVTLSYTNEIQPGTSLPAKAAFQDQLDSNDPTSTVDVDLKELPVLGQYTYNLDLGGATLASGSTYAVRFKAQGALLEQLQSRLARGADLANMTDLVSRDADGTIWLTMQVQGPAAEAAPKSAFGLLAADCQNLYGETIADVEANNRQQTVCPGAGSPEWWAANKPNAGVAGIMTHDSRFNGGGCVYFQYDPALYVCRTGDYQGGWWADRRDKIMRKWFSSSINANVRYASDDSRINGRVPSGARALFSHAQTPLHTAALNVAVPSDGVANTIGQKDVSGTVSGAVTGEPYCISSVASYRVDCSTVQVTLTKNLPAVQVSPQLEGVPTESTLTLQTTHGNQTVATSGTTLKPRIALNVSGETFGVTGVTQPSGAWVDVSANAVNASWNSSANMNLRASFSRQIAANVVFASNDTSVPQDQRPAAAWNGQGTTADSVVFAHAVSSNPNRPTNRDRLTFSNVAAASTWGLSGANGTVSVSKALDGVTLSGSQAYTVNGGSVNAPLTANLPLLRVKIEGNYEPGYVVTYKLDGVTKTMALPAPVSGSQYQFYLPTEDAVGTLGSHTFEIENISKSEDMGIMTATGGPLTTVSGVRRNGSFNYPDLKFQFLGVK